MKTISYNRKLLLLAGIVVALILLFAFWTKKEWEPARQQKVSFEIRSPFFPLIKEAGQKVLSTIL